MPYSKDRILTTHSGSLPRPLDLIEMNRARSQGQTYDSGALTARLTSAVREVVADQHKTGIDIPDDGEFGKPTSNVVDYGAWWSYAYARLSGFKPASEVPEMSKPRATQGTSVVLSSFPGRRDRKRFAEFYADPNTGIPGVGSSTGASRRPVCVEDIRYVGQDALKEDIENFKAALKHAQVASAFMCAVAPGSFSRGEDLHYPTEEAFVYAIAEAMREEYSAIVDAGFILQIDDPGMPDSWDMVDPEPPVEEYKKFQRVRAEALNHALRGLPDDRIRYHVCWGSWHGPHTTDIPLADIIDVVLSVNAGEYSVEAGNVRHEHEWRVWKDAKLPAGKRVLPGVVSHSTNLVEHPQLVADRICWYADVVGRENVIASTDCGLGGRVHPQIAWAKLEALVDGARLASQRLWAK